MTNHKSLILDNRRNIKIKSDLDLAKKVFEYSDSIFYIEPPKYFPASDYIFNLFKKYKDKIYDEDRLVYETLVEFGNKYKLDFIKKTITTFFKNDLANALDKGNTITLSDKITVNVLVNKGLRGILKKENMTLKEAVHLSDLSLKLKKSEDENEIIQFIIRLINRLLKENKNIIIYLFDLCLFKKDDIDMFAVSHGLLNKLNKEYAKDTPLEITSVNWSSIINDILLK